VMLTQHVDAWKTVLRGLPAYPSADRRPDGLAEPASRRVLAR
jgi:hypothetical protein